MSILSRNCYNCLMCLPFVVDRGVCRFVSIVDFLSLRCTSKNCYGDEEAYCIYSKSMPLSVVGLVSREKIGLHYLLGWALNFEEVVGSYCWYQRIVNWLSFRSSIKIMFRFLLQCACEFLFEMDLGQLSTCQRLIWLRFSYKNSRVFKRVTFDHEENVRPRKMVRRNHYMYRDILTCCG